MSKRADRRRKRQARDAGRRLTTGDRIDATGGMWNREQALSVCARGYAVIPGHLPLTSEAGATEMVEAVLSHANTVVGILADHYNARFHAEMLRCERCQALTVRVDATPPLATNRGSQCGACGSENTSVGARNRGGQARHYALRDDVEPT